MNEKPYDIEIPDRLQKVFDKLKSRDKLLHMAVMKKILQTAENPQIGKPMRNVLKGERRVHIGHFVLFYKIEEDKHRVVFLKFLHHDDAYRMF